MKIAYIAGVCVNHDAISNAIRNEIHWLLDAGHQVVLFAYVCDHADVPFIPAEREADIVFDPFFQQCDVAVFHFGVFYSLFNVIPLVSRAAKRVVVFHNITPKEFLPPSAHPLIDRSFAQLANMAFADHVICDSKVNQIVLAENGIRTPSTVISLPVHATLQAPQTKPSFTDGIVRVLFLGRFVKSKGPTELLQTLRAAMRRETTLVVQLDMIANLKFSDEGVMAEMEVIINAMHEELHDRLKINIIGNASEECKAEVLSHADLFVLPTYHEGFCVPILEAIASGCLVVCYDNSNTPSVSGALARLVQTGDLVALEQAIVAEMTKIAAPAWKNGEYAARVEKANRHVRKFSATCIREQYVDFIERRIANLP